MNFIKNKSEHIYPKIFELFIRVIRFSINPKKWLNAYLRLIENRNKGKLWMSFDNILKQKLKIQSCSSGEVILVDGLWDNPNHFFRLRLFLEALSKKDELYLAAFLKKRTSRSKNTLSALGFNKFFYISDFPIDQKDKDKAISVLKNVKNHKEVLKIQLPENLPPYILYDTVLKISKNPQTNLSSELWIECLSDLYRLERFFNYIFDTLDVKKIVLSHVRKNEFGLLLLKGIKRNITCFNIYAAYEMLRIRRFDTLNDLEKSMEILSYQEFESLEDRIKKSLIKAGKNYLSVRDINKNSDINFTKAYGMKNSKLDLKKKLSIPNSKTVVTVYFHAWYDFPHAYGMKNFTDFLDWTNTTLKIAKIRKDIVWLLKPHPCESWYGGFFLNQVAKYLPKNIHILDESTSVITALDISDFSVTVHGTISLESVAKGVPVICADKTWFEDWQFAEIASSRSDYEKKLLKINKNNSRVDDNMKNKASVCAYLTMAPGEPETKIKRLISDHFPPSKLFADLINIVERDNSYVKDQGDLIKDWLESNNKNFCIYHKINLHKNNLENLIIN